jgi:hypothetical protein
MAMRGGMYNANKRKKELARKKKQDEKRLKRQKDSSDSPEITAENEPAIIEADTSSDSTENI